MGLLQTRIVSSLGKLLALIKPVITRWTCHCLSISRLLEVQKPMLTYINEDEELLLEAAGKKRPEKDKAQRILDLASNMTMWRELKE